MIRIEFLGPLRAHAPLELEVANLGELRAHLAQKPELSKWLGICAVAVNDEIIKDENFVLKNGDRVLILPPVCGG